MSVESRVIVAPNDRERTAIVSIAMSAGSEVAIDPTWRFEGFLEDRMRRNTDDAAVLVVPRPQRIDVGADE